jgi:hypothetical protein
MSVDARAERCTAVTNAVFGEADGAAVLVELTPPLNGAGKGEIVRLGWAGNRGTARGHNP